MFGEVCKSHFVAELGKEVKTFMVNRIGRSLGDWIQEHGEDLATDDTPPLSPENVSQVEKAGLLPPLEFDEEKVHALFREASKRPDIKAQSASQAVPVISHFDLLVRPLGPRTSTPIEYEVSKAIRRLAASVDQTIQFNDAGHRIGHNLRSCRLLPAWIQHMKKSGTLFVSMLWLTAVHVEQSQAPNKTSCLDQPQDIIDSFDKIERIHRSGASTLPAISLQATREAEGLVLDKKEPTDVADLQQFLANARTSQAAFGFAMAMHREHHSPTSPRAWKRKSRNAKMRWKPILPRFASIWTSTTSKPSSSTRD
ncbi:unnamed protein product [Sympodiomycopsis kandeliae]